MDDKELYENIFKRKSIRNYDLTPLDENKLKEISKHLKSLTPLYDDIEVEFKIIAPELVKRRFMKKAPYYIAAFSEVKEGHLTNVGFMLATDGPISFCRWYWQLLAGNSPANKKFIEKFRSGVHHFSVPSENQQYHCTGKVFQNLNENLCRR